MSSSPVTRAPYPEHPNRCQGVAAIGQCPNLAVEGGTACLVHGGNNTIRAAKKDEKHRYNVAQWREKISRHAEDDDIKNLNAEIGVLRMLLETQLGACKTDIDLITNSPMISDMLMKVDKLVTSCHRLDDKMGNLLDKSAVISFAASVVEIIAEEVEDSEVVSIVADRIAKAIAKDTQDDL